MKNKYMVFLALPLLLVLLGASTMADTQTEGTLITISVGGDCTLGSNFGKTGESTFPGVLAANNNDYGYFFANMAEYFANDDFTFVNLESSLTANNSPKDPEFSFKGPKEYARILTEGSIEGVTVSNNHCYDYGTAGFNDTIRTLNDAGISFCGEGFFGSYQTKGVSIGMLGYCTLEGRMPSAQELARDVRYMSSLYDIVIVTMHWGFERQNYPVDFQKELGRVAIDNGADLVFGHHPHVEQGIEFYKGRYIVYSCGNLSFGGNANPLDDDIYIFQQRFLVAPDGTLSDAGARVIPSCCSSSATINNYQPTPYAGEDLTRAAARLGDLSKSLPNGVYPIPLDWTVLPYSGQ